MPSRAKRREVDPSVVYRVDASDEPFTGPKHAKVTLVKAYDFYCGYCNKVRPTLAKLKKKYGDDLRIVYKEFVIHDQVARQPALAACAAHKQKKFMPMFDAIWREGMEAQVQLGEDDLIKIGRSIGLSVKTMKSDMKGSCEQEIREDQKELAAVGTRGTPAFYVNGRFLSGALPIEYFEKLIDEELKKATLAIQGGVPLKNYYEHIMKNAETSF